MSLSARMREAATVLEEASERYGYVDPTYATWSARMLRYEAEHVEAEEGNE